MSDTDLHCAAMIGDLDRVKWLVEETGLNPNTPGHLDRTPLHYASMDGCVGLVKYLYEDKRCDPNCRDSYGWTPLHLACLNDRVGVACYLLQVVKCNPNNTALFGEVPLSCTRHKEITKALIDAGADPKLLYSRNLTSGHPALPGQAAMKIFMIGHPGAGKTTLTKALSTESSGLSRLFNHLSRVSGVEQYTAGIIPHVLESKQLGLVNILDLAGHEEFHASHDAVVHNVMSGSAGVFLVLVDLQKSEEEFLQSIRYWLLFVKNHAASLDTKPHTVIVGTHSDLVSKQDKAGKEKAITSLRSSPVFSNLAITGYIEIDSRYPESSSMAKLRASLSDSCKLLKRNVAANFSYHCFFIFLLHIIKASAVQLDSVISAIVGHSDVELFGLLPTSPIEIDEICQALSSNGRILYLRCSDSIQQSWIIIDQHSLLAKVNGTIFAPDGFKEHRALSSSTGVVPLSKLTPHFPDLDSDMMTQFLAHFEFCHEILDSETLQHLSPASALSGASSEQFFFFPALVSASKPERVWEMSDVFSYHTGWLLQCSKPEDFFSPRFLQVLLLRLAFSFALSPTTIDPEVHQHPALHRECKVWRNGIHWAQMSGVEGLVEITNRQVMVLVRSLRNHELAAVHLRSAIVSVVREAQTRICPGITPAEHIIQPSDAIESPLKPACDLTLISTSDVARALVEAQPCVVSKSSHPVEVEKLLYFEPYANLGKDILREIYDDSSGSRPIGMLLIDFAAQAHPNKDKFLKLFQTPPLLQTRLSSHSAQSQSPIIEMKRVLEIWADGEENATRQVLRQRLDKYSIFAGRNILDIVN